MILARKIIKMTEFLLYLPEKIYKIPEFYMIFARIMSEFYIIIARKIFFPNFREGGHVPPLTPAHRLLRLRVETIHKIDKTVHRNIPTKIYTQKKT